MSTLTLAVIATVVTLFVTRSIVIPIMFGIFFSLLLSPLVRWMRRILHIPPSLGSVIVIIMTLGALSYGVYSLAGPARSWADMAVQEWPEIQKRLAVIKKPIADLSQVTKEVDAATSLESDGRNEVVATVKARGNPLSGLLNGGAYASFSVLVAIFLALLLMQRPDSFLSKVLSVLPKLEEKKRAVQIARSVEESLSRYLVSVTIINLCLGVAVGVMCHFIGLPNAVLWGALAGILNFVPYLGALAGIAIVSLVSMMTFDNGTQVFLAPLFYLLLNGLEAYVITPIIIGRTTALSPVVVFIAIIAFGWLWGPAGTFLAVPIVMAAKIVALHLDEESVLGVLLSETEHPEVETKS